MGFCTLADVKLMLDIPTATTSKDDKLELIIDKVTAKMIIYLGFTPARTTVTSERHEVNNNQILFLDIAPIQSVSAATIAGVTVSAGTDDDNYQILTRGRLYRGIGWSGDWFTRGMAYDTVAGKRQVLVSYVGGWYYPGDAGYVSGADASLPYAISSACIDEVISQYRKNVARSEGLTSYKEGGVAWGWATPGVESRDNCGLSTETCAVLNAYRRFGFA